MTDMEEYLQSITFDEPITDWENIPLDESDEDDVEEELKSLIRWIKHLPGMHDQKAHGRPEDFNIKAKDRNEIAWHVSGFLASEIGEKGKEGVSPEVISASQAALHKRADAKGMLTVYIGHMDKKFSVNPDTAMASSFASRESSAKNDNLRYPYRTEVKIPLSSVIVYVPAILSVKDFKGKLQGLSAKEKLEMAQGFIDQDEIMFDPSDISIKVGRTEKFVKSLAEKSGTSIGAKLAWLKRKRILDLQHKLKTRQNSLNAQLAEAAQSRDGKKVAQIRRQMQSAEGLYKSLIEIIEKFSEAQLEAGNYKKKHITFRGLNISIENEKGTTRTKTGKGGKSWSTHMKNDYGYIRLTEGVDGDHVDVYLGSNEDAPNVYIIHQVKPDTGEYDEDKCMLGFNTEEQAKEAYLRHYDSPKFFGAMSTVPFEVFKEKVLEDKGEMIVPNTKELLKKSIEEIKHLPGRHDQSTHGHPGETVTSQKDFKNEKNIKFSSEPITVGWQLPSGRYVEVKNYHRDALRAAGWDGPSYDAEDIAEKNGWVRIQAIYDQDPSELTGDPGKIGQVYFSVPAYNVIALRNLIPAYKKKFPTIRKAIIQITRPGHHVAEQKIFYEESEKFISDAINKIISENRVIEKSLAQVKLEWQVLVVKHLPGQHDQKTHGGNVPKKIDGIWVDPNKTHDNLPEHGKTLASYTDEDGYSIIIKGGVPKGQEFWEGDHKHQTRRYGQMFIISPKGKTIKAGYWMDWPEEEWKISHTKYYNLSWEDRAALEVKQQATAYASLSHSFEFHSENKHLPGQHDQLDHGRNASHLADKKDFIYRGMADRHLKEVREQMHQLTTADLSTEQDIKVRKVITGLDILIDKLPNGDFTGLTYRERKMVGEAMDITKEVADWVVTGQSIPRAVTDRLRAIGNMTKGELIKANIDESTNGIDANTTEILYEIETNGAHLDDVFWWKYKEEIVKMEHEGLIDPLDTGGYGMLGDAIRTLKLTPKGRLTMMIGRSDPQAVTH